MNQYISGENDSLPWVSQMVTSTLGLASTITSAAATKNAQERELKILREKIAAEKELAGMTTAGLFGLDSLALPLIIGAGIILLLAKKRGA